MLKVWVAQPLVLEWPGTQQHHLSVWHLWGWSSEMRAKWGCSSIQHNYQYITGWGHSDWPSVCNKLLHHCGSYTGETSDHGRQVQVVVGGEETVWDSNHSNLISGDVLCHCTDLPVPVGVRAEVTADNTSIKVSWEWSPQGVLMCVDYVTVQYRPEGGSLVMYTVDNTTATSATLPNLQCNTKYTIWVHARGSLNDTRSLSILASLPARGMMCVMSSIQFTVVSITLPSLPSTL